MILLTLDTKKCMAALLLHETFDFFSFIEGSITTFNTFTMDGYLHKEFYDAPPEREFALWKDLRDYCFSIIKGKRTPLDFKFVFSLPPEKIPPFIEEHVPDFTPEHIQGLYLNFRYDGSTLTCTSGTSLNTFTLDKSLEQAWDRWLQSFFTTCQIPWESGI